MKATKQLMNYEIPSEKSILEAYERKNRAYNRADARDIKRALRRLSIY